MDADVALPPSSQAMRARMWIVGLTVLGACGDPDNNDICDVDSSAFAFEFEAVLHVPAGHEIDAVLPSTQVEQPAGSDVVQVMESWASAADALYQPIPLRLMADGAVVTPFELRPGYCRDACAAPSAAPCGDELISEQVSMHPDTAFTTFAVRGLRCSYADGTSAEWDSE